MPAYHLLDVRGVDGEAEGAAPRPTGETGEIALAADSFDFSPAPEQARASQGAAGLEVVVAAATTETALPMDDVSFYFIEIEWTYSEESGGAGSSNWMEAGASGTPAAGGQDVWIDLIALDHSARSAADEPADPLVAEDAWLDAAII